MDGWIALSSPIPIPTTYDFFHSEEAQRLQAALGRSDPDKQTRWETFEEISDLAVRVDLAAFNNPASGIGDAEIVYANRVRFEYLVLWYADLELTVRLQTLEARAEPPSSPFSVEAACLRNYRDSINTRLDAIPAMLERLYIDGYGPIKSGDWKWFRDHIRLLAQREDYWDQISRPTLEQLYGLRSLHMICVDQLAPARDAYRPSRYF